MKILVPGLRNAHDLKFINVRCSQVLLRYFSDDKQKDTDLYESLGLKSSASSSEIKKAYYDLTLKHHPDRNEGSVEASQKFREVTEAYEILGNYKLRKRYDQGLPLPATKSKTNASGPIVETPVKYQSFFDSRTDSKKYKSQSRGIEDDTAEFFKDKVPERIKKLDEEFEKSRGLQYFLAAFICTVFLVYKFYK